MIRHRHRHAMIPSFVVFFLICVRACLSPILSGHQPAPFGASVCPTQRQTGVVDLHSHFCGACLYVYRDKGSAVHFHRRLACRIRFIRKMK